MNIQEVLTRCQELGVKLVPGPVGKLRVSPPPEKLPQELREELRRHKQEILAFLMAEKAEETGKPNYRALYRQMTEAIPEDFPLIDAWLADNPPALWRKIRDLDDELTRLEKQGAPEETYRAKLEEMLSLCQAARDFREGKWGTLLIPFEALGGELVWVVKDEQEAQEVKGDGRAIYYADEFTLLKTKTPEQIRDVHDAKLVFPGARIVQ